VDRIQMMVLRLTPRIPALLLTALVAACGAEDAPPPEDTMGPPPEEGRTLLANDFVGIEEHNVAFNLHWVEGPVNRDPTGTGSPVTEVEEVSTMEGRGFDRVIFHFAEGEFPGYQLSWAEGAPSECASGAAVTVSGERFLRVRLHPVTATDRAMNASEPGFENLSALAPTCAGEGEVEWHLGVRRHAQVRVLEMREPRRLVVDVRHEAAPGH
jgi:hypothetical protein